MGGSTPILTGECGTGIGGVSGIHIDFVILVFFAGNSGCLIIGDGLVKVVVNLFVTGQHRRKRTVAGRRCIEPENHPFSTAVLRIAPAWRVELQQLQVTIGTVG